MWPVRQWNRGRGKQLLGRGGWRRGTSLASVGHQCHGLVGKAAKLHGGKEVAERLVQSNGSNWRGQWGREWGCHQAALVQGGEASCGKGKLHDTRVGQPCGTCGGMEYRRQGGIGSVGPALRQQHSDSLAGLLGLLIVHANKVGQ